MLGADPNVYWAKCYQAVYSAFYNDISQSYSSNISFILNQTDYDIKVLIYNGQDDIVCNTPGVERYMKNIQWSNMTLLQTSKKHTWTDTTGYVIGNYRRHDKLHYVNVYKAGHQVPEYQPWSAREMLRMFIDAWPQDI